ncbi:MAG: CsbD family protein [Tabrizicola sp.]
MNNDQIAGKWKQLKGEAKIMWGKLTYDELAIAEGHTDKLAGKIQERYGKTKEEARREVDNFFSRY